MALSLGAFICGSEPAPAARGSVPRRCVLMGLAAGAVLLPSRVASAGSYLNRAALLLDASSSERTMVMPRSDDEELLEVVHRVAQARLEAAQRMHVPKVIAPAHPHLLLVLENCERGYAAGLAKRRGKLTEHLLRARSEERAFRAMVEKLGYDVPST